MEIEPLAGSGIQSFIPQMPSPCSAPACVSHQRHPQSSDTYSFRLETLQEENPVGSRYHCQGRMEDFQGEVTSELVLIKKCGGNIPGGGNSMCKYPEA